MLCSLEDGLLHQSFYLSDRLLKTGIFADGKEIMRTTLTVLVLLFLAPVVVKADVDVENDEADSFTFSTYARIRYNQYGGEMEVPNRSFVIESAGFTADYTIDSSADGQLQIETTPEEVYVKDCFLDWRPTEFLECRMGQFKKPFCLNSILSRWDLMAIDHSVASDEVEDLLYAGRDIGSVFTVNTNRDWFPEIAFGVFNGSDSWKNQNNEIQYSARAVFELPMNFVLGGDYTSLRLGEMDQGSITGYSVSRRLNAWSGDLQFEADLSTDLTLLTRCEMLQGDNWKDADVITEEDCPAFRAWWFTTAVTLRTAIPALESVTA
ncbi:MAG: hypothetical protein GF388_10320, partial [Candidatus Aegiribacteria sp.]|nr:hypothetical protein [Candidatus Aegiribacteria sp.]